MYIITVLRGSAFDKIVSIRLSNKKRKTLHECVLYENILKPGSILGVFSLFFFNAKKQK